MLFDSVNDLFHFVINPTVRIELHKLLSVWIKALLVPHSNVNMEIHGMNVNEVDDEQSQQTKWRR